MNDLLLRRRQMILNTDRPPYDSRVEYLENSGTQYISMPLSVQANTYFAVGGNIIPIYLNTNKNYILRSIPNTQFAISFYSYNSSSNRITYGTTVGGTAGAGGITLNVGVKNSFEVSTLGRTVNGTFSAYSRPLTNTITTLRLFGGSSSQYPIKICNLYIEVGNTKVYDLIPVRIGQVGYMYDKISKQLFGNSGTGDFILGNDI